jgi:CIC family chloride channel protein
LRFGLGLALVACGAAVFSVVFRLALGAAMHSGYGAPDVVRAFHKLPWFYRLALPACGGLLAGLVTLASSSHPTRGQGVGDVMEAVVFGEVHLSMRVTLRKSLGSWLAIAFGGSIGREGPIIQFGGNLGQQLGDFLRLPPRRGRALIAAGTAAGFAAAYNTPLAAVLFVMEVVTGIVALDAILPALIAAALATSVTRAIAGGGPIYGARAFALTSSYELLAHALLGLLAALSAQLFMRVLSAGETLFAKSGLAQPFRAALGGLIVGAIACISPEVTGNGYEPINLLLNGALPVSLFLWLFVAKAGATTASVASGSPGGVFTPTLLLGALLGGGFWHLLVRAFGAQAVGPMGGYALVGMAALTAATTHAPLMAAVLVFELSGDYAIVVPLMLATAVAMLVSRRMRADSVYMAELRRRGLGWEITLEGRRVRRASPG